MQPSTTWAEDVRPDEAEQHARFVEQIVAMQTRFNGKYGPGRLTHRKTVAGLKGRLDVAEDLSDYAAQGLFAWPGTHQAVVRMANGSFAPDLDALPDLRGFAVSVRGLDGPGALGGRTDRQDFVLNNVPAFGFTDFRDFADVFEPSSRGTAAIARFLVGRDGPVRGTLKMGKLVRSQLRPFSGYASASFHSATPVQWGPYAAHVHIEPVGATRDLLAWRDFGADIRERLQRGPLTWHVRAQFYTDPKQTPIEDWNALWRSEKVTVGTLVLAESTDVETDRFDPWAALAEHRPLGEIMRVRKLAYEASSKNR